MTDHYEEHLRAGVMPGNLERCPHIIRKRVGDESYDICDLKGKSCLIEHGLYECETWEVIKRESFYDDMPLPYLGKTVKEVE